MKSIFTLAISMIVFSQSFGQSTFQFTAANPLYATVETPDGGYISVGLSKDSVYLVKVNAKAQTVWAKNVIARRVVSLLNIINTSDRGFALGVYAVTFSPGPGGVGIANYNLGIYKFDADANFSWQKIYDVNNSFRLVEGFGNGTILQTSDGGYFIAGNTAYYSYLEPHYPPYSGKLVKTDALGNVVWSKKYFSDAENSLLSIKPTTDGNYVFLAATADVKQLSDSAYLVKIDSSGNILWSKYLTPIAWGNFPNSLTPVSDGGFILTTLLGTSKYNTGGFIPVSFIDTTAIILSKVDINGNLVWSKTSPNSFYTYSLGGDVTETADHGLVFANSVTNKNGDSAFYDLVKLNNSGLFQWEKRYSGSKFNLAFNNYASIIHTADNGYIATGSGQNYGYDHFGDVTVTASMGVVFKFDSNFNSCDTPLSIPSPAWRDSGSIATGNVIEYATTATGSEGDTATISMGSPLTLLCSNALMPVTFINFIAGLNKNDALLQWQTANEINSSYFNVQRSTNGLHFTDIGKVDAVGNSTVLQNYSYTDADISGLNVPKIYYRLKEFDKNGVVTYSKIIALVLNNSAWVVRVMPNPVKDVINIYSSLNVNEANITLTDIAGKVLSRYKQNMAAGQQIQIPVSHFATGVYIVTVDTKSDRKQFKVIKQ